MQVPPSPAHIAAQTQRTQTQPRRMLPTDLPDLKATTEVAAPPEPKHDAQPVPPAQTAQRADARPTRPGSLLNIKV
jgi:hypothetical protein